MPAKSRRTPARASGDAAKPGRIDVASLVGGASLLAIVSDPPLAGDSDVRGWLVDEGRRRAVSGSRLALSANGSGNVAQLFVLNAAERGDGALVLRGRLVLEHAGEEIEIEP